MTRIETVSRTAASLVGAFVFAALFVAAAVPIMPVA